MRKTDLFISIIALIGLLLSKSYAIFFALLALDVTVILLIYFAKKNPYAYWVQVVFGMHGPRTDTKYMVKEELFQSASQFFRWAFNILLILVLVLALINKFKEKLNPPVILLALFFMVFILFLTALGGGIYSLIRGIFKKKYDE
ncbi:MAG: hypothetical protein ABSB18_07340 [Candidatus Omnitrophota bacterium]